MDMVFHIRPQYHELHFHMFFQCLFNMNMKIASAEPIAKPNYTKSINIIDFISRRRRTILFHFWAAQYEMETKEKKKLLIKWFQ